MKSIAVTLILVSVACAGCAAPGVRSVTEQRKMEVRQVLAPEFSFPAGKEEEAFSVLAAVIRLLESGEKIESLRFKDATHVTVFLSAPGFSIHGGPFIEAVWDRGEWKFGNRWSLL